MDPKSFFFRFTGELKMRLTGKVTFSGKVEFPKQGAKPAPEPTPKPSASTRATEPRPETPFGRHGAN